MAVATAALRLLSQQGRAAAGELLAPQALQMALLRLQTCWLHLQCYLMAAPQAGMPASKLAAVLVLLLLVLLLWLLLLLAALLVWLRVLLVAALVAVPS